MKKKLGSLKFQLVQILKSQIRFGQSKHVAKAKYREECKAAGVKCNPASAPGIFSYNTYNSYCQTCIEFAQWLIAKYNIKDIACITREMVKEYLIMRDRAGLSAWTVSKDMASFNKVFSMGLTKKEMGLRSRRYQDVKRSRVPRACDTQYNPDNYASQILLAKASGCRRESVKKVIPEDFIRDENRQVTSVWLKEKGGRVRYAPILAAYREQLTQIVDCGEPMKPLFSKYTKQIDNHAFRREYSRARFDELARLKNDIMTDYKGYDKSIIAQLSQDLGHNRLPIVVYSYLR